MKVLIQRVKRADITINGVPSGSIDTGLVVYIGYSKEDVNRNEWLVNKLSGLRVFEDQEGRLNLSVREVGGKILIVSNFTLCGNCNKGFRPSFDQSMEYNKAQTLYYDLIQRLSNAMPNCVVSGEFGADMQIQQLCDGPVNLIIE